MLLLFRAKDIGEIFFSLKPEAGQARFIRRQQDAAQRGIVMQGVHPVAFFFLAPADSLSHSILKSHLHLAPYLNGSLLPQFQAVTAARAKHALDGRAVSFQQRGGTKAWIVPAKPPPCIRQAPPPASRMLLLSASAMLSP